MKKPTFRSVTLEVEFISIFDISTRIVSTGKFNVLTKKRLTLEQIKKELNKHFLKPEFINLKKETYNL